MELSIIIVNYNVRYFLEQCLNSVERAIEGINAEVFIVDNASADNSCQMLQEKFSHFNIIESDSNLGFSKANNLAIARAQGKYILLLNPDTVVGENTFKDCIRFMNDHPKAGGLGVRMIDGKGRFLPESKRGLPTPLTAFYKIFGVSSLFPKSKKFNPYHLGHLDEFETNEIDVLSGAFMFMRKSILDQIGMLDETYFMYGEDIDLSYRITMGGYSNYYFPKTTIIHYKGESTKKGSLNYVLVFYKAMAIFAKQYFSEKNAQLFSLIINLAIYFRAFMAIGHRILRTLFLPLFDFWILSTGIYAITIIYETQYKYVNGGSFEPEVKQFGIPLIALLIVVCTQLFGGYKKKVKFPTMIKASIGAAIILMISYSLLDESLRFSRVVILLSSIWVILSTLSLKPLLHALKLIRIDFNLPLRILVVGNKKSIDDATSILLSHSNKIEYIGHLCPSEEFRTEEASYYNGRFSQITDITEIYEVDELLFCEQDLNYHQIIKCMETTYYKDLNFKLFSKSGAFILGSDSVDTQGDLYTSSFNYINQGSNPTEKRLLDILLSLFFIATLPFLIFIVKSPFNLIQNLIRTLGGQTSLVGYYSAKKDFKPDYVPKIKPGILHPGDIIPTNELSPTIEEQLNINYASHYSISKDLKIISRSLAILGRKI